MVVREAGSDITELLQSITEPLETDKQGFSIPNLDNWFSNCFMFLFSNKLNFFAYAETAVPSSTFKPVTSFLSHFMQGHQTTQYNIMFIVSGLSLI